MLGLPICRGLCCIKRFDDTTLSNKCVSDLLQVGDFIQERRIPPSIITDRHHIT